MSLSQRLSAAGLRPTTARVNVLQILDTWAPRRLDADSVFRELMGIDASTSLSTVYRTLKDLENHKLLHREWTGEINGRRVQLYARRMMEADAAGVVIVCPQCGCTMDISESGVESELRKIAVERGFELIPRRIEILGTCRQCDSAEVDALQRRCDAGVDRAGNHRAVP